MDINELCERDALAKDIWESAGSPSTIAPPSWGDLADGEMCQCQNLVFRRMEASVQTVNLDLVIERFDCIGFMDSEEMRPWLPVWMCGCLAALLKGLLDANILTWTLHKITESLENGVMPFNERILCAFELRVCEGDEMGLHQFFFALAKYHAFRLDQEIDIASQAR